MEMSQGKALCSYLKQPKMSFFSSSFLIQNQRTGGRTGPACGGWYQWKGVEVKEWWWVNTVQILCIYVGE
jgi:hypothetical protein